MSISAAASGSARLTEEHPGGAADLCELDFADPFQLLTATILSAQTTDVRVNLTTPALFARYPTPQDLAAADPAEGVILAKAQFDAADNMTDRQGALSILVSLDSPERAAALDAFYDRFRDDPLVLDKWFALQALAQRSDTIDDVERLAKHPAFTLANPNRLRALAASRGWEALGSGASAWALGLGTAISLGTSTSAFGVLRSAF